MDFLRDIKQFVLSNLPCVPSARPELEEKDARELLIIFQNWQERLIQPIPRQVHWSRALLSKKFARDQKIGLALDQIVEKLEIGRDVTPHLSRSVIYGYQEKGAGKRRRKDLDLMLNDWGVHHLHLSVEVEADGFVRRSASLLFVFIRNEDVYLLDIMNHGDWVSRHIFRVMVEEWPEANLAHEVQGVLGQAREISEIDHEVLRRKHVNTFIDLGNKIYMPTRGLTAAGSSITATIAVDNLIHVTEDFAEYIKCNPTFFPNLIRGEGVVPPQDLDLHFLFFDAGGYGVIETQTGIALRLDR